MNEFIKKIKSGISLEPILVGDYKSKTVHVEYAKLQFSALEFYEENMFEGFLPEEFQWGQDSTGASKLAMMLLSIYMDTSAVLAHYRAFKKDIIQSLPKDNFRIGFSVIERWVADHE